MLPVLISLLISAVTQGFQALSVKYGKQTTELAILGILFVCALVAAAFYTLAPGLAGHFKIFVSIYLLAVGWFNILSMVLAPFLPFTGVGMGSKKE